MSCRQRVAVRRLPVARLPLAFLVALCAGCAGDQPADTGEAPVACSITGVGTGVRTSWTIGIDPPAQVRWLHSGDAASVRIDLLKHGAAVAVIADTTENDGYYHWVPDLRGLAGGSGFGLRISAIGEPGCSGEVNGLTLLDYSSCHLAWTLDLPENTLAGMSLDLT